MQKLIYDDDDREYLRIIIRGSRCVHSDDAAEIYSIESKWAARFWFGDTHWCVKDNPWFEDYVEEGPLLFIRSFKRKRDYLLAPASGEFRSRRNRGASFSTFVAEHPSIGMSLTSLGVFWHRPDEDPKWNNNIYYCPRPYGRD